MLRRCTHSGRFPHLSAPTDPLGQAAYRTLWLSSTGIAKTHYLTKEQVSLMPYKSHGTFAYTHGIAQQGTGAVIERLSHRARRKSRVETPLAVACVLRDRPTDGIFEFFDGRKARDRHGEAHRGRRTHPHIAAIHFNDCCPAVAVLTCLAFEPERYVEIVFTRRLPRKITGRLLF